MRYHIDTIPVWDAVKLKGECPLCAIRRKNELYEVQRYLGASVMEPDTRIQVNEKGFCQHHQQMLFSESNRLGVALMMHSHLKETEQRLGKLLLKAKDTSAQLSGTSSFQRMLGKGGGSKDDLKKTADAIKALSHSCILCDSLNENMNRYLYTFLHLWKTDADFRRAFAESKGVCIPDTAAILEAAPEVIPPAMMEEFVTTLSKLLTENLKRVEEELEWFTLKFDYRNNDKPWGNSKDAPDRAVNKLRGWCVGEEPNPKER